MQSNIGNIVNDLTCPITLDLLSDPVRVPCCNKAFSRSALSQTFAVRDKTCPMCNANLDNFDVTSAPKDIILESIIESYKGELKTVSKKHHWECTITPVNSPQEVWEYAQLKLTLEDSKFSTKPSLFIAVLDRSGSMGGSPGEQVKTAIRHIDSLAKHNPCVQLVLIAYDSFAEIISSPEKYNIQGGTNFMSAYQKIKEILNGLKNSSLCSINIAFLTDGQDGSDKKQLTSNFRDCLRNTTLPTVASGVPLVPITVHTVGFGTGCDKELLESMRLCGTQEGTFRYAEPGDDSDTLCHKVTTIFEMSSKASTVQVKLSLKGLGEYSSNPVHRTTFQEVAEGTINFPVNSNNRGEYKMWVKRIKEGNIPVSITVSSDVDDNHDVPVQYSLDRSSDISENWYSFLTDRIASSILKMTENKECKEGKENKDELRV